MKEFNLKAFIMCSNNMGNNKLIFQLYTIEQFSDSVGIVVDLLLKS